MSQAVSHYSAALGLSDCEESSFMCPATGEPNDMIYAVARRLQKSPSP